MVCLHTCLQFLCAEAKLVMRGYYRVEKTYYLPPPLISSVSLISSFPLSLSVFYDNVVGKQSKSALRRFFHISGSERSNVHTGPAGFDPGIFQVWTSSKTSSQQQMLCLFPFLHIYGTVQHTSF